MTESLLDGVAIIGMAGRFPGARDVREFWANLLASKDSVTRFASTGDAEDYVAARGVLDDAAMFDADYFGLAPREADRMDPQHRVFLEACVGALEDAGYVSDTYAGEIGLFAGCSLNTYLLNNLTATREDAERLTQAYQVGEFATALGNDKDFLTTRAAYKLNLRGPVVSVQSACATGLVAVCQAAQSLLNFGCDMALAGGVSITFPQERGHAYQEGGMASRDGHCRPFDAAASGTVFSHGVGVVLLKRLEDAVRDGDHISGVIRGFAVNNDGSAKAGFMAPGVDGQARVIAAAQAMADVAPETITYVEAHGTGTPLGDPVEIAALKQAFRAGTDAVGFCSVGTAKGNVGHLDAAAGVTGLIKTALQLQHRTLPGLKHFVAANPNIDLVNSPFTFSAETRPWQSAGPLRAGVSAFGVGGVNAHVVLEEAPAQSSKASRRAAQVLTVSGHTEAAALRAAAQLADFLSESVDLADAAFTLAVGRKAHGFRVAVASADAAQAKVALGAVTHVRKAGPGRVGMLFSGQGTQFCGMGRELYETEAVYREAIDSGCALAQKFLGFDLRALMFAAAEDAGAAARLERTENAQPAIFITELALAELWQSWGIRPVATLGHSLGDYVAATLAGVFTREKAIELVCRRGQLMGALPAGSMLSVATVEQTALTLLGAELSLAAVNGSKACVVSGPDHAVTELESRLTQADIACRRLRTSHAFHSVMMQPMLADFAQAIAAAGPQAPARPFVSSVTGTWITAEQAQDPQYWAQQCVRPVRFHAALQTLVESDVDILLEAGPGETLTTLALQGAGRGIVCVPSFGRPRDGMAAKSIQNAVAALWQAGANVDWQGYFADEQRLRVSLPTYPFERKLHWVEPPAAALIKAQAPYSTSSVEDVPMLLPAAAAIVPDTSSIGRPERLRGIIAEVLTDLSGIETTPQEAESEFLELGFDSLFLTQATQALSRRFGVKLTFRMLMEQFSSIASLADHLDAVLPVDAFAAAVVAAPQAFVEPMSQERDMGHPALAGSVDRLLSEQLAALSQMFAQQVAALQAVASGGAVARPTHDDKTAMHGARSVATPMARSREAGHSATAGALEAEVRMVRPGAVKSSGELTAQQQQYIDALIANYEQKTAKSKRMTQQGRTQLADPRAVAGFRPQWKEMVYPLLVERARGSRLWDVDGHEYIDIVNGYGCIMFGHSPEFVVEAATRQLESGVAIGPQSPLAAEVAALLCDLTGNERVTFCNTGSEAVMAAIRVARTVTGRDKFVYFAGDYHGTFDEVLIRNTPRGSAPVAPGIPVSNTTNVVVLEYGTEASLNYLRDHAEDIAAVLIEPVQTRHPENKPFDFIRNVRTLTEQTGTAMILDEVVTGFRVAPGGMQEFLGIRADMCTYGKVIGGGHPIGVLSGKAQYLDALDGGAWQFGDDSAPEVGVTFFAGTFVRHPLALAACRAVLLHLKAQGAELQRELNRKTTELAERLDAFFVARGVPSRIHHFCSWFYFTFANDARLGSLLYYAMRSKGIHIQEGYPCFLTTAHSDDDLAEIERVFKAVIVEMQEAGVLPAAEGVVRVSALHAKALATTPERVPLTEPQQEVFLAAALSDDANCAFNESLTLHLDGPVRFDDLLSALHVVIERHDALRSVVSDDGEWLQVGTGAAIEMEQRDISTLDGMSQDAAIVASVEHEAVTPFDLQHGPLVRVTLFRQSAESAVLLLTAHHIVLDGWSANQLLEELGKVYSQGGEAASLGALLPFSSYAVLEAQRAAAGEFNANEDFWVAQYAGRTPRLELPTDRARTLSKSYRGSTLNGSTGPELYAELKRLSTRAGCTLYVALLSGFELLLHRLTGQAEVVVGISTAGQALYEGASLVGHAVHFLPMLSEITEATTAKEHMRATRTALLDAYEHQEFTYGSLLRKLKLEREAGRLPLIEVQFNLEKVGANVAFDGLAVTIRSNPKRYVNTDLFLNVMETADGLDYTCDYNSDLFDEATIARWIAEWLQLLRSESANLDAAVYALDMLTPAELHEQVTSWNDTATSPAPWEPLTSVLMNRAGREPDRKALTCGEVSWSCAQLMSFARNLAGRLQAEGLEAGGLVGIALPRSAEMVAAVLAVMLAGGTYVPLDPRHPQERLAGVLADSGASLLLCANKFAAPAGVQAVCLQCGLQAERAATALGSYACTEVAARPADLAYVIYTSGTTGKPKGVAIEHASLMNLLRSMQREPGLSAQDALVAVTTLSFDIAALELLLPLLCGAHLVIATDLEVQDGPALLARMQAAGATALQAAAGSLVVQATPGAWRLLLDSGLSDAGVGRAPLKALCGGEALPRELAEKLLPHVGELWNMYGPTETTIWSSATRVTSGTGALRLGAPIANTQFYVLDAYRKPVALGVTGELYIGGAGVARGYWKREELTAEKFAENPFAGCRMYAAGDLARRHADGSLELLGRADFQVKVRGYRIELQEVEAALMQHAAVQEAAVAQVTRENGSSRLVGYVTARGPLDLNDLAPMLARSLPEYMVPASFMLLEEMPRTANGKLDRKHLPTSDSAAGDVTSRPFQAAQTATEQKVERIWAEVLELPRVSVTESIFELGADSLLIFRIAARSQREGLPVRATEIFQHRTIAALSASLDSRPGEDSAATVTRGPSRITAAARQNYRVNPQDQAGKPAAPFTNQTTPGKTRVNA